MASSSTLETGQEVATSKKHPNAFSYLTAKDMNNGVHLKEFSYKDVIKTLESKLGQGNVKKFSYGEALSNYLHTKKKIPVELKTKPVDLSTVIDLVKTSIGQGTSSTNKHADASVSNQATPSGKTAENKESISLTIGAISKLLETIAKNFVNTNKSQNNTSVPVTSTTTELPETEAPESGQTASDLPITQQSRCFCMAKCTPSLVREGFCGRPNSSGIRMSKCCKSITGNRSSVEEAEEEEF